MHLLYEEVLIMKGETKEERFKRVVEKRVQNILDSIRRLSQCSNRRMYKWNDNQLKKIWDTIEKEMQACKSNFNQPENEKFKL